MNGLESGLGLLPIFIFCFWISTPSVTIKFDDTVSEYYYLLFTFLLREIIIY